MEKNWLQHYPSGIPKEINPDKFRSVVEVFDKSCAKFGHKPAFVNMDKTLSFTELEAYARNFAAYIQNHTDLKPGDRIAIQMPNLLQYPIAMYGALRAGLIVVNTNPLYTPREMEHQFKDAGVRAIVVVENFAASVQQVLKNTDIKYIFTTGIGDMLGFPKSMLVNFVVKYIKKMVPDYSLPTALSFKDALHKGASAKFSPPTINPDDVAFLQYTGGTTGVSKGAMLTHRNLVANMEQIAAWVSPALKEGQEIVITPLPLYHVFALTVNCLAFMQLGGMNVLITNPRDIPGFIKELRKYKFTLVTGVNTLFNALLNNDEFAGLDFSSLKLSAAGGMAVQQAVVERWRKVTKSPLIEGFGLTEASPATHFNPIGNDRVGYIGVPLPSTDCKIVDDDGKELGPNTPGEICIQGPQVMKGYWQRPEETDKVIKNGWLYTGDIGIYTEDCFFKIVDRKKDMIIVSGFNVFPNEIEDVLALHPGILELAVIGVPDERSGEVPKVFVVKKDPKLTEEDLRKYCEKELTNYKRPKHFEFRTELPKTNVGKILRRKLKEEDMQKNPKLYA